MLMAFDLNAIQAMNCAAAGAAAANGGRRPMCVSAFNEAEIEERRAQEKSLQTEEQSNCSPNGIRK